VVETFNLFDANVSDIDYFYASRLPGEPAYGVEDIHTHPASRAPRASVSSSRSERSQQKNAIERGHPSARAIGLSLNCPCQLPKQRPRNQHQPIRRIEAAHLSIFMAFLQGLGV
jgi:hypothetical protein